MKVKLEEVCKRIYAGGDVPKDSYSKIKTDEYSVPIYANAEKDDGLYGYTDKAREKDLSITVAARGTIGYTSIRREPFLPVVRLITVVPDTEKISERYLYYVLKQCKPRSNGTSIPQLTVPDIKKNSFELYEISEQIKIADRLDKVSKLINLRMQELSALDNLIKARFVEMFGDPIINPKGYIKLTVAEAIEAGYIEKPFDGNHGSKHPKASEYVESGIPFLMANNVIDGNVDLINCSFITEQRANKLDKGFAKDQDVLITHKGTIGRTAVLRTDYEFVMLTPQVAAYRVKKGITPDYLCSYFTTEYFQNDMRLLAAAGGSTRAYAGITAQLQLQLIIPPLDEQKTYTNFIKQVDKSKFEELKVFNLKQKIR